MKRTGQDKYIAAVLIRIDLPAVACQIRFRFAKSNLTDRRR